MKASTHYTFDLQELGTGENVMNIQELKKKCIRHKSQRHIVQKAKNILYGQQMLYNLYFNISVFPLSTLTKRCLQRDRLCGGWDFVYKEHVSPWVYHFIQTDCKVAIASSPWQWWVHEVLLVMHSRKVSVPDYGIVSLMCPQCTSHDNPSTFRLSSSMYQP